MRRALPILQAARSIGAPGTSVVVAAILASGSIGCGIVPGGTGAPSPSGYATADRRVAVHAISAAGWEQIVLGDREVEDVPPPAVIGAIRRTATKDAAESDPHIRYPEVPLSDHPDVTQYVRYYTKVKRVSVEQALQRRARVIETVRPIFEKRGLPSALIEIALLESTFNTDARSSCGKTIGMWQLSVSTGKLHGLRIDRTVDERRDLIRSSEAAASLLEDLYTVFDDWYLAVAAYNAGKGRVLRAVEAGATRDPFQLAARGLLSETTRQFVARFAALNIVMARLGDFGFSLPEPSTVMVADSSPSVQPVDDGADSPVRPVRAKLKKKGTAVRRIALRRSGR